MIKYTAIFFLLFSIPISAKDVNYYLKTAKKYSPYLKIYTAKSLSAKYQYKQESMFKSNPVVHFGYSISKFKQACYVRDKYRDFTIHCLPMGRLF